MTRSARRVAAAGRSIAVPLSRRSETAPLSDRMGALEALRLCLLCVVLLAALIAPELAGRRGNGLLQVAAVYAVVQLTAELVRRAMGGRGLSIVGAMLLVDGLFVAAVLYRTGGASSYLAFLVELDIVAVCLLVSYRTGLKLALWYTLLFGAGHYLIAAGVLHAAPAGRAVFSAFGRSEVFGILSLWLVALSTAAFSSLNERELRRGRIHLRALAAMSADLTEDVRGERVPILLLDRVLTTFGLPRGAVVLNEDVTDGGEVGEGAEVGAGVGGTTVSVTTMRGRGTTNHRTGRHPWPDEVAVLAAARKAPVLLRALGPTNPLLSAALPNARNVIVLPLVAGGRDLGVVALERGRRADVAYPARTLDLFRQFAAHAALALHTASLHAEVERMATIDPLTGLCNRRVFGEALNREAARAARLRTSLSLVLIDIDHFKTINDTYGHQAGDEVLRQVGAAIGEVARDADVAARFGGEEFVLLLPDCGADEAGQVAERVRAAIAARDHPAPITASAGVAIAVAGFGAGGVDGGSLVRHADEALYRSKRAGRDRTTVSRPVGVAGDLVRHEQRRPAGQQPGSGKLLA